MTVYFGATPGFQLDDTFTVDLDSANAGSAAPVTTDVAAKTDPYADAWNPPSTVPDANYHPQPPPTVVAVSDSGGGSAGSSKSWLSSVADIFKATATGATAIAQTVDIHGRPVNPGGFVPPPQPAFPVWLMPVAVIGGVLLLVVAVKKNKRTSVAGYRRKSRRSRR